MNRGKSDRLYLLRSVVTCVLIVVLTASPALAQNPPAPKLKIVILEGDGAINNQRQRVAREPTVQVVDENNNPVVGASVLFTLPARGPGAVFTNGSKVLTVVTDSQGKATASGLVPNNVKGAYQISASASHQGENATTTIGQTNAVGGGMSSTMMGVLGAVGAAAAAGVVAATRGSEKSKSPTTISAGTPNIRPPQ